MNRFHLSAIFLDSEIQEYEAQQHNVIIHERNLTGIKSGPTSGSHVFETFFFLLFLLFFNRMNDFLHEGMTTPARHELNPQMLAIHR